jgi:hypothetical protein
VGHQHVRVQHWHGEKQLLLLLLLLLGHSSPGLIEGTGGTT